MGAAIPETQVVDADGVLIYVIHDAGALDVEPAAGGFGVVVAGHSHQPRNERRDGVLWFNPGSAGPRRFKLPIAVGKLTIDAGPGGEPGRARGEILTLALRSGA